MPMSLMFSKTYSSRSAGLSATSCSMRTRKGMAMKKGSQLRRAFPLRSARSPEEPRHQTFSAEPRPNKPEGFTRRMRMRIPKAIASRQDELV